MTKREYLESKGYKCESWYDEEIPELFYKMYEGYDGVQDMTMYINWAENKYFVNLTTVGNIENQRQIDDLQIAFNNVKHDFEEMQKMTNCWNIEKEPPINKHYVRDNNALICDIFSEYGYCLIDSRTYEKEVGEASLIIVISPKGKEEDYYYLKPHNKTELKDFDTLKAQFNQLQRDFEEIEEEINKEQKNDL